MQEKSPADVLEEAADLLLIHGRCLGNVKRDDGTMCVLGALSRAGGVEPANICIHTYDWPARIALERHLASQPDPRGDIHEGRASAWVWNDHIDDDFEVIDTLRAVAKDLRNEAS